MSRRFLVQVGATDPNGWVPVEADNVRHAGAIKAAEHGPGLVTVYATDPQYAKHPNGVPFKVHEFKMVVTKKPQVPA